MKPVLELDGTRIHDLASFFDEVSRALIPGADWGRNLDAWNDILRGGFGTPPGGFLLRWHGADASRRALGMPETIRWLENKLTTCHPANVPSVREDLERARRGEGPTLFEIIVDIVRVHGPGGEEADDGVELELA